MLFKNGVLLNSVAAAFFGLLVMPVFAQPCLSNSCSSAFALTTNNLVSFEVAISRDVANNEVNAYLVKNTTAKTAKELANKINPIINHLLLPKNIQALWLPQAHKMPIQAMIRGL